MNLIAQFNGFWHVHKQHAFNTTEIALYFELLKVCNNLFWENPFSHKNKDIQDNLNISFNTLTAARNRLQTVGLIAFTTKNGSAYVVYTLLNFDEVENYEVYLKKNRSAYKKLATDDNFIRQQERYHPNVDIRLSLEKACTTYWCLESTWQKMKEKSGGKIDFEKSLINALSLTINHVCKQEKTTKTLRKVTLAAIDDLLNFEATEPVGEGWAKGFSAEMTQRYLRKGFTYLAEVVVDGKMLRFVAK